MTGQERREQLLDVGRALFADKGFEAVSVEEIAAKADVSKPVVYEHFGGKEGLYAVLVDREMNDLLASISDALTAGTARALLEQAGMAKMSTTWDYDAALELPAPTKEHPAWRWLTTSPQQILDAVLMEQQPAQSSLKEQFAA